MHGKRKIFKKKEESIRITRACQGDGSSDILPASCQKNLFPDNLHRRFRITDSPDISKESPSSRFKPLYPLSPLIAYIPFSLPFL
jgi:hypothetical protein